MLLDRTERVDLSVIRVRFIICGDEAPYCGRSLFLENFDADAKWRTKQGGEGGVPLDTSAVLWDGTKIDGPVELKQALLRYSPQFVRMITEKLMTFSLGRGVEYEDMPVIRSIVRDADKNNDKFSSLLLGVIRSAPFQMRVKDSEPRP